MPKHSSSTGSSETLHRVSDGPVRRVLVSAGDPSGDLILAKVVAEIRSKNPNVEFVGLCGPASEAAGVKKIASSADVAVVGIWEVLFNLNKIFGVLGRLKNELPRCTSVLCVDFPDFNLRLAALAQKLAKPVDYIVAPQVWAWRSGRMDLIRRLVRRLYPALPFELNLFRDAGVDTRYFGHPMRDMLPARNRKDARTELNLALNEKVLLLMPGSRKSEISKQLPLMIKALGEAQKLEARYAVDQRISHWKFLVPIAPGWSKQALLNCVGRDVRAKVEQLENTHQLIFSTDAKQCMMAADFGWITSGTATLEAAFYQLPHILVYLLSGLSVFLIRQSSGYFSRPDACAGLPNILMEKKVIPELLQQDLTPRRLALDTLELLDHPSALAAMRRDLRYFPKILGEVGATSRIAQDLMELWGF